LEGLQFNLWDYKSDVKNVDTVQEQYSELFSGLCKTGWEYTIKLKPGYVPFALSTPRRGSTHGNG
jgi:hypothetical protein